MPKFRRPQIKLGVRPNLPLPEAFTLGGGGASGPVIAAPVPLVLLNRTSSLSVTDGTAITFNNEVFDSENIATTTTITPVAAGLYRVSAGTFTDVNTTGSTMTVAGGQVNGKYAHVSGNTAPRWTSGQSGVLSLSASQAIQSTALGGTANHNGNYVFFGLERLDANLIYARGRLSADQTSFTSGNVAFNTLDAGAAAYFDTSTGEVKVPAGALPAGSRIQVRAAYALAAQRTTIAEITRNGATDVAGMPSQRRTNAVIQNLVSAPRVIVGDGTDKFKLNLILSSSSSVVSAASTWIEITVLSPLVGSVVALLGTPTISTVDAAIAAASLDHDTTGAAWSIEAPTKLIVPSGQGWTHAAPFFYVKGELNDTARVQVQLGKTGSAGVAVCSDCDVGAASAHQRLTGVAAWMPVTALDEFTLIASCSAGTVVCTGGYFGMLLRKDP